MENPAKMSPNDNLMLLNAFLIYYYSILYVIERTRCLLKGCCAVADLETSQEDLIIQESNWAIYPTLVLICAGSEQPRCLGG